MYRQDRHDIFVIDGHMHCWDAPGKLEEQVRGELDPVFLRLSQRT
jgi:hypothetical protein